MKRTLLTLLLSMALLTTHAAHIKGGFFSYQYLGPGQGTNLRYRVTLTVYMICDPTTGQLSNPINFSIFNAANNQFIQNISVPITNQYNLGKAADEPCITGDQSGCYYTIVVYDLPSLELAPSAAGYIISYQRCCRIAGINNIQNSGAVGNTFSIQIPGTNIFPGAETNSSPRFLVNDTAVVCANNYFQYSFQASDIDGDSLAYELCDAIQGGDQTNNSPATAANPPYSAVPYSFAYLGSFPMGPSVTINSQTGLISGTGPSMTGEYVVAVCVREYRNGTLIGTTRKELHVRVGDCNPLNALLSPRPTTCDGFTVNFSNETLNPPNAEFVWSFGEPFLGVGDTSYVASPTHTYSDTGVYIAKLKISLPGGLCSDTANVVVRVYPGFFPGFTVTGNCYTTPYQFTDTTRTNYGIVDSWSWNFGDGSTLADTSHNQNSQWTFATPGPKTATLIVSNSKGCRDTTLVNFTVLDKPVLNIPFRDTLICVPDTLRLQASGSGAFSWLPNYNIINPNSANPQVYPTTTTWYYVSLTENGCANRDSVRVRVAQGVQLLANSDTTICRGDAIQLLASGNATAYSWSPPIGLSNPNISNPIATPLNSINTYQVVGSIGTCRDTRTVRIRTIPYPQANAGNDLTLCFNTSGQLQAQITGSRFQWNPSSYLNNPSFLNPLATPPRTLMYKLIVYDTLGCPKPGIDSVLVTVQPRVRANAGRDTSVVVGQPLQLNGTGGVSYSWSPATGLNNTNIPNPIGIYGVNTDSVRYKLIVQDAAGCRDSAYMTVRVYRTSASIFVPTAFTPNGDGLNDLARPICVGIKKINYFTIYNRWGQLVYSTNQDRQGWNGIFNGVPQGSAVFVWVVSAEDYNGLSYFDKGTVTLIR
ncbi:MAG: PKD domain-containing protein [Bacteroidota bacterium]